MLSPIGTDIWVAHQPMRVAGLFPLGHRMTVFRLPSGGLLVHSPVRYCQELGRQLNLLGPVEVIVAPSRLHDSFLAAWFAACTGARFFGPPGISAPAGAAFTDELRNDTAAPWTDVATHLLMDGIPRVNETVFLHHPSNSLIVADLVFNLSAEDLPPISGQFLRLFGTYDRFAVSRLFRACVQDSTATRADLDRILTWDFDRIIVGHGRVLEGPAGVARQHLKTAWNWLAAA